MQRISITPSLTPRPVDGHKGLFGRILVIGGQATMIGAPALSGRAALVMGSGLVQVAVPQEILVAVLTITPELIGLALDHHDDTDLLAAAGEADVVAIGPGMGQSPEAQRRLLALLKTDICMVIDADALNLLARQPAWPAQTKARAILTPHPGEMKRLCALLNRGPQVPADDTGRIELATAAATAFGQIIVLKGHRTVVTDGTRVYLNHTGNSALSKAGAGDVLTGLTASLVGQKMDPFAAACAAVHLHGRAGEIASQRLGLRGVLAHDVIAALPQAVTEHTTEHG